MVTSAAAFLALLCALAVERGFELWLSSRHARRSLARGGFEVGRGHYRVMAVLHAAFLASCALEVVLLHRPFPGALGWSCIGAAAAAQMLRYWCVATLGERWSTRIIVVPDAPPVTSGPYRWLRHPNYLAVALEIAAVPLIHGAWLTAIAFSLGNAAVLFVRIRAEEQALGDPYAQAFADRPRLVPNPFRR